MLRGFVAPQDVNLYLLIDLLFSNDSDEIFEALDLDVVEFRDQIALPEFGFVLPNRTCDGDCRRGAITERSNDRDRRTV